MKADLFIAGGGLGGCSAALAACRQGLRVVLSEETRWLGGQLTSQGVPPDEHGWIERFGCNASYRTLRDGVRDFYRRYYPLSAAARQAKHLNPGNGWVSPLCHEPRVAAAVIEAMLAAYESAGLLNILRGRRPKAADVEGARVRAVDLGDCQVEARWFIDATELGDLLPLTGTEFVTGAESRAETGEPSAPLEAAPSNAQAFSWCFAMDYDEDADHTIDRPARYDYWRDYQPKLSPPWPGPLLSWNVPHPRTMETMRYRFEPHREEARAFAGLWSYRRLIDRSNFTPGFFASDICLVNWPLIDYLDGDLCTSDQPGRLLAEAREMSLCAFYWLQTECGWRGLRLRGDVLGTSDGLAQHPYIRESRRIRALTTVVEQSVAAAARPGATHGEHYPDSVGVGYYRIDLHPSTGGDNYIDVASLPFEIPLRALIPVRMENLLPACKNIGVTHITNGCYRLHPVEWAIGEAAGSLAAFCQKRNMVPAQVAHAPQDFQAQLAAQGVEMRWPDDLILEEGDPHIDAR